MLDKEFDETLKREIECLSWTGSLYGEDREIKIVYAEWSDGTYPVVVRDGAKLGNGHDSFGSLNKQAKKKALNKLHERWDKLGKPKGWFPKDITKEQRELFEKINDLLMESGYYTAWDVNKFITEDAAVEENETNKDAIRKINNDLIQNKEFSIEEFNEYFGYTY